MKKFGRGYVLDIAALQNEVRSLNQKPPDDATRSPSATTPSYDVTDGSGHSPATNPSDRVFGSSENQHGGSGADATPSPTDEEDPSQGMKRRGARMSVSRTGRLKNRDRQRISVLQTAEFYGVKPDVASPPSVRGNTGGHPTLDASGRKASDASAAGLPSETLADFDGVIAALDGGGTITKKHVTNCYSF